MASLAMVLRRDCECIKTKTSVPIISRSSVPTLLRHADSQQLLTSYITRLPTLGTHCPGYVTPLGARNLSAPCVSYQTFHQHILGCFEVAGRQGYFLLIMITLPKVHRERTIIRTWLVKLSMAVHHELCALKEGIRRPKQ